MTSFTTELFVNMKKYICISSVKHSQLRHFWRVKQVHLLIDVASFQRLGPQRSLISLFLRVIAAIALPVFHLGSVNLQPLCPEWKTQLKR